MKTKNKNIANCVVTALVPNDSSCETAIKAKAAEQNILFWKCGHSKTHVSDAVQNSIGQKGLNIYRASLMSLSLLFKKLIVQHSLVNNLFRNFFKLFQKHKNVNINEIGLCIGDMILIPNY